MCVELHLHQNGIKIKKRSAEIAELECWFSFDFKINTKYCQKQWFSVNPTV